MKKLHTQIKFTLNNDNTQQTKISKSLT